VEELSSIEWQGRFAIAAAVHHNMPLSPNTAGLQCSRDGLEREAYLRWPKTLPQLLGGGGFLA
jgi:hypothetical protein